MKGVFQLGKLVAIFVLFSCSSSFEKMVLPKDLALVNQQSERDSVCFTCTHQVVVFYDFDKASFFPFSKDFLWTEFKEKFPEVGFIFYFSGQDREKLVRELEVLNFPYPGFHDPEFLFYQLNQLDTIQTTYNVMHCFHLKDGIFIKRAQIGMGEYFLEELEGILQPQEKEGN